MAIPLTRRPTGRQCHCQSNCNCQTVIRTARGQFLLLSSWPISTSSGQMGATLWAEERGLQRCPVVLTCLLSANALVSTGTLDVKYCATIRAPSVVRRKMTSSWDTNKGKDRYTQKMQCRTRALGKVAPKEARQWSTACPASVCLVSGGLPLVRHWPLQQPLRDALSSDAIHHWAPSTEPVWPCRQLNC